MLTFCVNARLIVRLLLCQNATIQSRMGVTLENELFLNPMAWLRLQKNEDFAKSCESNASLTSLDSQPAACFVWAAKKLRAFL